jgi:hypothetical protein
MRRLTPAPVVGAVALNVALLVGVASPSLSEPITYTEQLEASGSLDGSAFTDAAVTLTMHNDTNNVVVSGYAAELGTATVSVAGLGADTFKDQISVVDVFHGTPPYVGFEDLTIGQIIVVQCGDNTCALGDTTFGGGYLLATAIGPITGEVGSPGGGLAGGGNPIPTIGGDLILSSTTTGLGTFTATAGVIPEPATWVTMLMGFAGLGAAMRSRRKSAPAAIT